MKQPDRRLEARHAETVHLRDVDDDTFEKCYDALMRPSFSQAELMTFDEIQHARHTGESGGVVMLADGAPLAIMVTEEDLGGRGSRLAYLVVAADSRGKGIGSQLLDSLPGRQGSLVVLAEIEDPRFHAPVGASDPVARLRFYDRAGSRLLPLDYVQPSLREGSPRVENLLLITVKTPGTGIEGQLIADFLAEYYAACEGHRMLRSDPAFVSLSQAAQGDQSGWLRSVPLQDLDAARTGPS
jgi:GNAT superfamily N-acetyltransferase